MIGGMEWKGHLATKPIAIVMFHNLVCATFLSGNGLAGLKNGTSAKYFKNLLFSNRFWDKMVTLITTDS